MGDSIGCFFFETVAVPLLLAIGESIERSKKMTLKELQSKIERTSEKELPTAAKLRSGISPLVVCRDFDGSAQLSVYKNGFALYQSLGRSTVFRVDACGGYTYFGRTEKSELDEKFFRDTEWWVRLMM